MYSNIYYYIEMVATEGGLLVVDLDVLAGD